MNSLPTADSGVRLAELMASLSMATDLGMGQPMEHAMITCVLAVRLGASLGMDEASLRDVYYEALLRYIGCNAETSWIASIVGDELALRAAVAEVDAADNSGMLRLMLRFIRYANAGAHPLRMAQAMARGLGELPRINASFFPGHCEVAQRLAQRMNFGDGFQTAIGQIYARWDGKGVPALKGEAIAPALLCVSLAQDAVVFYRLGGVEAATAMARERGGGAHAPKMVEVFCEHAARLFAGLAGEPTWDQVMAIEPGEQRRLSEAELDTTCEAIADYVDIKSPYLLNHSSGVAALAYAAAGRARLPESDAIALRRASWLHDIGRVGVSAGIWGKPGPLSEGELEKVRLHPYYTGRVLARSEVLTKLGALAALHHERLDGSGYHRGLPASMLPPTARILAAADAYQAMTEPRPHRAALTPEQAAAQLRQDVKAGKLDADAASVVLASAGHRDSVTRKALVAGLSEREVEVLRLIARSQTIAQIAAHLVISKKTADRHIQNIYAKINVNTRAGATLYAMENRLL